MENDNTPQQEIETEVEIPVEIILGLELESLDSTNYSSLTHPIELSVNSKFNSWEIAEHYLKEYERQKGFVVNKYRVEYIQLLNSTVQIPRRRIFACEYAGKYKLNYKSKQIDQQRNKGSKKTDCKWIKMKFPKIKKAKERQMIKKKSIILKIITIFAIKSLLNSVPKEMIK
ncbi:hypothetical protein C1646_661721 [Rhizophagus diaphanus]|nr:hypothetical protein C1646_661721 [Rhizophagus diaphanus] [Rhizophagus sp. MUCL 43196]